MPVEQPWVRCRLGDFVWFINRAWFNPDLLRHLADPHRLMAPPAQPIPRRDAWPRSTQLARARLAGLPEPGVIIKRYQPEAWWQTIKDVVRPSRARRAFFRAFALRDAAVLTPAPVAVGERRCCRWLREAFLITEEIPGAQTVWEQREHSQAPGLKRTLARALGRTLARLHDAGLAHTDPNFSNFLLRGGLSPRPELIAIDLDGVRRKGFISAASGARDLARLARYMESGERLWFVAQYCRSRTPRLCVRKVAAICQEYIDRAVRASDAAARHSRQARVC